MINWNGAKINNLVDLPLSDREVEVLYFIVKGWSAKAIGMQLGISKRTVEHYSENIKAKFKVKSKSEVVAKIIDLIIIPPQFFVKQAE